MGGRIMQIPNSVSTRPSQQRRAGRRAETRRLAWQAFRQMFPRRRVWVWMPSGGWSRSWLVVSDPGPDPGPGLGPYVGSLGRSDGAQQQRRPSTPWPSVMAAAASLASGGGIVYGGVHATGAGAAAVGRRRQCPVSIETREPGSWCLAALLERVGCQNKVRQRLQQSGWRTCRL